jgi:hypothetical protein
MFDVTDNANDLAGTQLVDPISFGARFGADYRTLLQATNSISRQ